ncbi:hypothetical protein RJ640_025110 [Escallonia rubra]|uniref:Uncharacterized protein n=1 Tax=Escallonia rubra TaxID=112253 RepID=A0AA88RLN8_9ASTE|nr:hypothetical protein RJ640_025110 [Escallonia rubra]
MGIKLVIISFILISFAFSFLYIPTHLTKPILRNFRPTKPFILPEPGKPYPVSFAYLISGSKGDAPKLKRVLLALYHPGNHYLIHMDYDATEAEHKEIAEFVSSDPTFCQIGNVWVVGKPNVVTYRGPTMLANTLHAMSMLLRIAKWDWFINLSASDYPLVTQDGMFFPCDGTDHNSR